MRVRVETVSKETGLGLSVIYNTFAEGHQISAYPKQRAGKLEEHPVCDHIYRFKGNSRWHN